MTYARVAKAPVRWRQAAACRTLVIADEAHHLGEELAWGESFASAFGGCPRWLLLSGTPFRSDATPIPGVRYDADGLAEPDVSYGYADAVADRICRPVCFVAYDGTLSWRSGEQVIESSFETVLCAREASRRYRTAISTELPDGLPRILRESDERLRRLRREGHGDAAGLVIAADSGHARRIAALLREATGKGPVVVLHAESRAASKLAAFTHSREPWIVAVNMVSEGVDIPRLRVGVYATAAKTPLVFRQIVGRFVRTVPGRPVAPSWLYIPADAVLRDHAASIEGELRHALRRREDDAEALEFDRPERAASERGETPAFVPLSADVAPQLTLFGPVPSAPGQESWPGAGAADASWPQGESPRESWPPGAPAPSARAPAVAARVCAASATPAFERRDSLRRERRRLVSRVGAARWHEPPRDERLAESQAGDQERRAGNDSAARAVSRAPGGQAHGQASGLTCLVNPVHRAIAVGRVARFRTSHGTEVHPVVVPDHRQLFAHLGQARDGPLGHLLT